MRVRRGPVIAAAILLAVAVGAKPMMESVVRQMIYPAPPVRVPSPPPPPLVEVGLAASGAAVSAWFLPPSPQVPDAAGAGSNGPAPLVLMLHGNGENLETMRLAGLFEEFRRTGAGVLAIDYPGYGRSAGTPGEAANVAAAEAGWTWLRDHAEGRPLVAVGWSLGAAVAAQVAARHADGVDGVILLSAWDRLDEVARLHFPSWMVSALLSDRYDTAAAVRTVVAPALVVHGDRDDLIPIGLGRKVHAALAGPGEWVEVRGAGHNDLLGRPETWQAIDAFLATRAARSP